MGVVEVVNAAGEGGGPVVDGLTRYDAGFSARFYIGEPSFCDVACAVHRLNFAARTHGLREGGINQAGENADNGDNDEQLDERETFLFFMFFIVVMLYKVEAARAAISIPLASPK